MENWTWFILTGLVAGFTAGAMVRSHGFGLGFIKRKSA